MRYFRRQGRRFTTLAIVAALLFTHSALAVAACLVHLDAGHEAATAHADHEHSGHTHDHHGPAHGQSFLCQLGGDAQAQSRDYVKTVDIPAPVTYKVQMAGPVLPTLAWPARIHRPRQYVSAAPPPLSLTILFSRFRN